MVIEDTEITGGQNGIQFANWTCRRCNIHGQSQDGVKLGSNVLLEDSWIHDLAPESGAHADAAQMQNGVSNLVVRRNTLDSRGVGEAGAPHMGNAALFVAPSLGPNSDGPVLLENNLLAGGNFTLHFSDGNYGQYHQRGVTIRGNRWKRGTFRYGPVRVNDACAWTDNAFEDGVTLAAVYG